MGAQTASADTFTSRALQLGHSPDVIKRDGSQTIRKVVESIQELRSLIGPADHGTRKLNQVGYDLQAKAEDGPCCFECAIEAYLHGTGSLTAEQHAELAPHFPVTVTLVSADDYTLPLGNNVYGPNQPPVVLNYGTLTIPYGAWITTLTTNLVMSATTVIVSPPITPSPTVPSYQIGIFGAAQLVAAQGTPGNSPTTPGSTGSSSNCIWGGGGCNDGPGTGGPGTAGGTGNPGAPGNVGNASFSAKITIGTLTGALNVASQGGAGQQGGQGGTGGTGSPGGLGGNGVNCGASGCAGGDGGTGGTGGNGGVGGNGGNGGAAQIVNVTVATLSPSSGVFTNAMAGVVGTAGLAGVLGVGGSGGPPGTGGHGRKDGNPGAQGAGGTAGSAGSAGTSAGPVGQIIVKQPSA